MAELEEVGINLDLTVAVVDAESLEKIITLDIVKKQLENVDLVLLNKCDLATLSQVSDAEDILERVTGGAKVVRSQFGKVPLDLVIDCSKIEALNAAKVELPVPPVLSHEAIPKMAFGGEMYQNPSVNISYSRVDSLPLADCDRGTSKNPQYGLSQEFSFSSVTFESEAPLSLFLFQSKILKSISNTNGLLRAKGILYFSEDRENRFVFQWSGLKRVEAVSGRTWDGAPSSCLVFIGHDKSELDGIISQISQIVCPLHKSSIDNRIGNDCARSFSKKVVADGRFKDPSLKKEPLVIFGLKGSPLRGIKESHLNGALMRVINGKGNIFLSATASGEEYNLQLLFGEGSDLDKAWNEVRVAATSVISKLCKNFCPCRSELAAHVH